MRHEIPDDAAILGRGRGWGTTIPKPVWLIAAAPGPIPLALYDYFAMHLLSADAVVCPPYWRISEYLGLARSHPDRAVRPHLTALTDLGAVTVLRRRLRGMRAPNSYSIHVDPPDGYDGPRTVADYYRLRGQTVPDGY